MKTLKLILEAALFVSFVGFFGVMFINPGYWMGIFGSLFFVLLPLNLILGRIMKQGKIKVGKGGYFVLVFTVVIGLLLLYMSISSGDKNLVYDSKPLFMEKEPACQQNKCEIGFSVKEDVVKGDGQIAFVQLRVRPIQILEAPKNMSAELIGPGVNLKTRLDSLTRENAVKRTSSGAYISNRYWLEKFYTQELQEFYLKPGDYKLIIQTTDNRNLLNTTQYVRGLVYTVSK